MPGHRKSDVMTYLLEGTAIAVTLGILLLKHQMRQIHLQ